MLNTLTPGDIFKGYQFLGKLGEGGMGEVWQADQLSVKREVAIKIIKPERANEPDFIRRFEREAELVARLEHPNIVPLYDFWREPDGAFLVMRFLRGGSLQERLEAGAQSPQTVFLRLEQIVSALTLSHREGVIHRDIKPANILLDEDGVAYLADFGLAKQVSSESSVEASGSLGYAAPEQLMGTLADVRVDIFSLGVVVYELLTGQRAFHGPDWLQRLLHEPLGSLSFFIPELDDKFDDVIQRATAKNPEDRFESVAELLRAFREAVRDESSVVVGTETDDYSIILDTPNPYKGLKAFQEADEDDFFGREALTTQLIERMSHSTNEARFLAVVGPSGSGKSSVVKAGLIPALRRGALPGSSNWFILDVFPGAKPFEELEAELLRVAVNPPATLLEQLKGENGIGRAVKRILPDDEQVELLLVIDQFEELFTLASDEDREHFLAALIDAINDPRSRLRLIITLRADFYDRPLNYRGFGELLKRRTEVVLPLSEDELRAAISTPAEESGSSFEPGLVETIIQEVGEEPGILPLLQYALTELYERRKGRMLTHEAYTDLGGVTGALSRRAEELFTAYDAQKQETVRQVFLRLISLGEGTEDTRRRVHRSELSVDADKVLDQYGAARLLTFDRDPVTRGPTVEVAHETLIRSWERLRNWIEISRDDLRLHHRFTQSVQEWIEAGHDPGFLASDARLLQLEAWAVNTPLVLNEDERIYLDESLRQRAFRKRQDDERKAREAETAQRADQFERRSRQFRRASSILGIVGVLAIILTTLSAVQLNSTQAKVNEAVQRQGTAEGNIAVADLTLAASSFQIAAAKGELQRIEGQVDAVTSRIVNLLVDDLGSNFLSENFETIYSLEAEFLKLSPDYCPRMGGLALARSAIDEMTETCGETGRNEFCYHRGNVEVTLVETGENYIPVQPGETIPLADIGSLMISPARTISDANAGLAMMRIQSPLLDTLPGENITVVLIGGTQDVPMIPIALTMSNEGGQMLPFVDGSENCTTVASILNPSGRGILIFTEDGFSYR